ncbi:MAG: tRNA lysidine(34) synthetase TilS, partial [Candidatus Neomarinimicrobiota bacterium]
YLLKKNESIEMWARRMRQKYFELARENFKCDFIFTAHHLNDKVETILMNLDKGCSIEGLRGIPKKNKFILRPLLDFKRKDIELYIDKNNLPFVEDSSNYDISIKRNLVRHNVLNPWQKQSSNLLIQLDKISKDAVSAVKRMNSFIQVLSESFKTKDNCILIKDEEVTFLSLNQKVRLIKYLIGDEKISWRYNRWKSLEKWIDNAKIGSHLKLNLKWKLLHDRSKLILKKDKIDTDGFSLILKEVDYYKKSNNSYKEIIDGSSIEGKKLKLREWRHGDSFQPLGMTGKKKISDLLIDKKIDFFHKEKQMVVTADKKIIWVCGHQISETVKVLDKTTNFMELSLK